MTFFFTFFVLSSGRTLIFHTLQITTWCMIDAKTYLMVYLRLILYAIEQLYLQKSICWKPTPLDTVTNSPLQSFIVLNGESKTDALWMVGLVWLRIKTWPWVYASNLYVVQSLCPLFFQIFIFSQNYSSSKILNVFYKKSFRFRDIPIFVILPFISTILRFKRTNRSGIINVMDWLA